MAAMLSTSSRDLGNGDRATPFSPPPRLFRIQLCALAGSVHGATPRYSRACELPDFFDRKIESTVPLGAKLTFLFSMRYSPRSFTSALNGNKCRSPSAMNINELNPE